MHPRQAPAEAEAHLALQEAQVGAADLPLPLQLAAAMVVQAVHPLLTFDSHAVMIPRTPTWARPAADA